MSTTTATNTITELDQSLLWALQEDNLPEDVDHFIRHYFYARAAALLGRDVDEVAGSTYQRAGEWFYPVPEMERPEHLRVEYRTGPVYEVEFGDTNEVVWIEAGGQRFDGKPPVNGPRWSVCAIW